MERQSLLFSVFIHVCALLLAAVILAPILWLFIMSISPAADLDRKAAALVAADGRFLSLRRAASRRRKQRGRRLHLPRCATASRSPAWRRSPPSRLPFRPAGPCRAHLPVGWSLSMVIATYMLPPVALAVPLYMGLSHLGMLNNVFGLALVYLTILAPFTTWLMKSGFDSIPREIESAAMIDGAGLFQTLRHHHAAARRPGDGDVGALCLPACLG